MDKEKTPFGTGWGVFFFCQRATPAFSGGKTPRGRRSFRWQKKKTPQFVTPADAESNGLVEPLKHNGGSPYKLPMLKATDT